jgi:uncharacterized membrane protein (DUF4010 family)
MGAGLDPLVARDFAIALAIGALIGLEREKKKAEDPHAGIGGLRTFILIAEAGALCTWLAQRLASPWIVAAGAIGVAAMVVAGYAANSRVHGTDLGITTEVAALATFLLGAVTMLGTPQVAVALAIATSAALAFKQPLHRLVLRIGTDDLYAGLKLLIATFIVLPLLPDRPVDPWGAINPYRLWWFVILIAGLSLAGYVAVRLLGAERGTVVTGLAGGLVSSTATTLAMARTSRQEARGGPGGSAALAAGVLVAWTVMFVRVLVEVAVVHAPLLDRLSVPFAAMGVGALASAGWFYSRGRGPARGPNVDVPVRNPFSLTAAIKFAALFAVVLLVVKLVEQYLGPRGFYLVAGLAGLTDVDAITLSMASNVASGGDAPTAARAITIAALSNTLVKCGFVAALGAGTMRTRILAATAAILAAGAVGLAIS